MRVRTSLPTNLAFFNKYADLLPTLQLSKIVANIISGATEIFVIFTICHLELLELAPKFAFGVSVLVAILGTITIEIGLRKFCPSAVKAILFKRFKKLELWLSIFVFIICTILISTSALLSFQGSFEIVENLEGDYIYETDAAINLRYENREDRILKDYEKDKNDINKTFEMSVEATQNSFDTEIKQQWNYYRRYETKEANENISYKSKKTKIKERIDELKTTKATKIAAIQTQKNDALQNGISIKNNHLKEIKADYSNDKRDIKDRNRVGKIQRDAKIQKYGMGLGYFTLLCLFVFLICTIIIEIIKKGSGMEETPTPTNYFFKQGLFFELWETGQEHLQRFLYGLIRSWTNQIKPPLVPSEKEIPILFDVSEMEQMRIPVRFKKSEKQTVLSLPTLSLNFLEQLKKGEVTITSQSDNTISLKHDNENLETAAVQLLQKSIEFRNLNLIEEANDLELKADGIIKMYLGKKHRQIDFVTLKKSIIDYLNGENDNPFGHHHRKPIKGFQQKSNTSNNFNSHTLNSNAYDSRNTTVVEVEKLRSCLDCGSSYVYKQWNQKFCSEKCRINNWQKKNGRELKKKKRKI